MVQNIDELFKELIEVKLHNEDDFLKVRETFIYFCSYFINLGYRVVIKKTDGLVS